MIMKHIAILLAFTAVMTLAGCSETLPNPADSSPSEEVNNTETSLESNIDDIMAEQTWAVVIDMNHPLAGKTLNFEVEIMNITKGSGATLEDTVESGDNIEVHYVGTLEDGEQFDSSRDRGETLPFTVGAGQMISGFDAGVVGMKLSEVKNMTLEASEAYGEKDENKTETIPKADLASFVAAWFKLEVGEKLPTQFGEFEIIEVLDEVPEALTETEKAQ